MIQTSVDDTQCSETHQEKEKGLEMVYNPWVQQGRLMRNFRLIREFWTRSNKLSDLPRGILKGSQLKMQRIIPKLFFCSVFTQEDSSNLPEAENIFSGEDPLVDVEITAEKVS